VARLRRAAKRQIEREDGASGRIGRGFDLALMRLDDRFDQTQAEADAPPRAALIAAARLVPGNRACFAVSTVSSNRRRACCYSMVRYPSV
jgi:hypothetical protein